MTAPQPSTAAPPRPDSLAALDARIATRQATIAVVGLGYVGLPLTAAAAGAGFPVVGLEADTGKLAALAAGRSPITDLSDADVVALDGRVQFTDDPGALAGADVICVTVPTPLRDGVPDLSLIEAAGRTVAAHLRPGHLVVLESTTYPGTTEELLVPLLESASGLDARRDFAVAFSPERVNPGSSWSVATTPKVVGGHGREAASLAAAFYGSFTAQVHVTRSPREAEMAKLIENTFRQVNIALVNELATVAPALGVDLWDALDAAATKPFGYLPFWPGAGVGGHCIAIDPTYLSWRVEQRLGFGVEFVQHARAVNNRMPGHVASRVAAALNDAGRAVRGARVVVLGVSYKPDVGDVRESPAVAVLDHLADSGAEVTVVDPYVSEIATRTGVYRCAGLDAVDGADIVVLCTAHRCVDYDAVCARAQLVFDATGVTRARRDPHVVLL